MSRNNADRKCSKEKLVRAPSSRALRAWLKDIDAQKARRIRTIIKAKRAELVQMLESIDPIHAARRQDSIAIAAILLDSCLGTFGVEYIFPDSRQGIRSDPENTYDEPIAIYCNSGDAYAATLVHYRGRWQIATWGDIAEKHAN